MTAASEMVQFRCITCRSRECKHVEPDGSGTAYWMPWKRGRRVGPFCSLECSRKWDKMPQVARIKAIFGDKNFAAASRLYESAERNWVKPQTVVTHSACLKYLAPEKNCTTGCGTDGIQVIPFRGNKFLCQFYEVSR